MLKFGLIFTVLVVAKSGYGTYTPSAAQGYGPSAQGYVNAPPVGTFTPPQGTAQNNQNQGVEFEPIRWTYAGTNQWNDRFLEANKEMQKRVKTTSYKQYNMPAYDYRIILNADKDSLSSLPIVNEKKCDDLLETIYDNLRFDPFNETNLMRITKQETFITGDQLAHLTPISPKYITQVNTVKNKLAICVKRGTIKGLPASLIPPESTTGSSSSGGYGSATASTASASTTNKVSILDTYNCFNLIEAGKETDEGQAATPGVDYVSIIRRGVSLPARGYAEPSDETTKIINVYLKDN